MEQQQQPDALGEGEALQPYQFLRRQRSAAAAARRNAQGGLKGSARSRQHKASNGGSEEDEGEGSRPGTGGEEMEGGGGPSTSGRQTAGGAFGADVDDIWEDPVAAKIGLTTSGRRRRGKRGRKARKRLAISEEVSKKLGQANLMYATSRCVRLPGGAASTGWRHGGQAGMQTWQGWCRPGRVSSLQPSRHGRRVTRQAGSVLVCGWHEGLQCSECCCHC